MRDKPNKSEETELENEDAENLTTNPNTSDKKDAHVKNDYSLKNNGTADLENSIIKDENNSLKAKSLSLIADRKDNEADSSEAEYDLEQIMHLSADCKSYVISTSRICKQFSVDDCSNDNSINFSECLKVNGIADESVDNNDELIIHKEKDTNRIDKTIQELKIKDKSIVIENSVSAKTTNNKNLERNPNKNPKEDTNRQTQSSSRPFQNILIGNDGRTQRIAVIYRKGEANPVDRTCLLNHISSLITDTGQESANLKIIEIEVDVAGDNVEKAADLLLKTNSGAMIRRKKTNRRRLNAKSKDGNSSSNSQGFALKVISLPTKLGNNRVSRGITIFLNYYCYSFT